MSFPSDHISWKSVVQGKGVLFDAVAIINILKFKQEYVLSELKSKNCEFFYISPVLLELLNSKDRNEKLARMDLLLRHEFIEHNLTNNEIKLARTIRESVPLDCQPSPTDLYLGGTVGRYSQSNNMLLLTANLKDFPLPVYKREGYMLLQNDRHISTLTFLSLDLGQLSDL